MDEGCRFTWTGIGWIMSNPFACPVGQHCAEPGRQGNFIGDTENTNCVQDQEAPSGEE